MGESIRIDSVEYKRGGGGGGRLSLTYFVDLGVDSEELVPFPLALCFGGRNNS